MAWRDISDQEFIQKLHCALRTAGMPLIAWSVDRGQARENACLRAGSSEYLIKSLGALVALGESLPRCDIYLRYRLNHPEIHYSGYDRSGDPSA